MPKINFKYGLVKGHYDKDNNLALLGLYNQNNTFLGTDRLSMGVNKQFLQYISMVQSNIIFEGDRLFSLNNLIKLNELYDLRIIILVNSPETLLKRHKDRNDTQTDKFLKGRSTKIKNIKKHVKNNLEHDRMNHSYAIYSTDYEEIYVYCVSNSTLIQKNKIWFKN